MSSGPTIEVRQLCFRYSQERPALDAVSFIVEAGESIGLVGPNGAGKTSLFLCLAGILTPSAGSASVGGLDVRDPAQRKRLPQTVGIVFQDSDDQLFCSTVGDDVAFGPLNLGLPLDEVRQRVSDALERVGMTGTAERVPLRLSGGEKRRVALAGVLAMRPAVLLLDEPSMFLDPRGRRELITLLNALGGTKVIASHDLEFVRNTCRRVLVLDGGKVSADGAADVVLADAALMQTHGLEVPWSLRVPPHPPTPSPTRGEGE